MSVHTSSQGAVIQGLNTTMPHSGLKQLNSIHDHSEAMVGQQVEKTLTVNGNGVQNDNVFLITGAVEIVRLWAECTEATNATTLSAAYFDLYDGTVAIDITENGGTDLSGMTVGDVIAKDAAATTVLKFDNNVAGVFVDGVGAGYYTTLFPFRLNAKSGANTYIRFNFSGDANTDVDIKFKIRFIYLSDNANVTAV